MDINDNIGLIGTGLHPDILSLYERTRTEANKFLQEHYKPIDVKKLAKTVYIANLKLKDLWKPKIFKFD